MSISAGNVTELVTQLQAQQATKYDVVAPASQLHADGGMIGVRGGKTTLSLDGVTAETQWLQPNDTFDSHIAGRLGIPVRYVRTMRDGHTELWDQNVNYWLKDQPQRKFLLRAFRSESSNDPGIARALLSDRYRFFDNLDATMAVLDGLNRSGLAGATTITGADITDDKLFVRIEAPSVAVNAEWLLDGYRSPYRRDVNGTDLPMVWAGFVMKNSETGGGAFTIVPRLVVEICTNGMQMGENLFREVHLGSTMDEGMIRWSDATTSAMTELVAAKTADVVTTVLSEQFVADRLEELRASRGVTLTTPQSTIVTVGKNLGFSDREQEDILAAFIGSGDPTAFGVTQAITAACQQWAPARRDDAEAVAVKAGALCAAAAV